MTDEKHLEGVEIAFASGGLPDDEIELRGVRGREELSRLFAFDLLLVRPKGPFTDDELDALLDAPCAVALGPRDGDVVHGLLERIELLDASRSVAARYVARLVPTAWMLTISRNSRIFQEVTVPAMVESILVEYGMTKGVDFDLLTTGGSPTREYVVQYQESDWDFIQRWLEHEGFFYWFEHGKDGEKLVIADANDDTTAITDPSVISYRERNNLSSGGLATIWDWGLVQRRVAARVAVLDYNYRAPDRVIFGRAEVDAQRGFGSVISYGEHVKDAEQAQAVARVRAERLLAERRVYSGKTDCARFRAGHHFELENHHAAENDGSYLVTSVTHRVGHPFGPDRQDLGEGPQRYLAHFEAIPFEVQYRPARVTPWPRIQGVMHAHISADTSGDYAQIDDQGRYKVKLPFDASGRKGSKASRWIRLAQPYSGSGYGTHFPLHKGAEVLLAHIDGDPDRPIIVGAVPNARTRSPSTSANATQSVIQTASGVRIEMEDLA